MDVRTICHIFNFIGCGDIDWLIVKSKNQLDVIVINEYRFDKPVNQTLIIFFKPQIEVAEFVEGEDNKLLGNLRSLGFLQFDVQGDFFFLCLKLLQASLGCASDNSFHKAKEGGDGAVRKGGESPFFVVGRNEN